MQRATLIFRGDVDEAEEHFTRKFPGATPGYLWDMVRAVNEGRVPANLDHFEWFVMFVNKHVEEEYSKTDTDRDVHYAAVEKYRETVLR